MAPLSHHTARAKPQDQTTGVVNGRKGTPSSGGSSGPSAGVLGERAPSASFLKILAEMPEHKGTISIEVNMCGV